MFSSFFNVSRKSNGAILRKYILTTSISISCLPNYTNFIYCLRSLYRRGVATGIIPPCFSFSSLVFEISCDLRFFDVLSRSFRLFIFQTLKPPFFLATEQKWVICISAEIRKFFFFTKVGLFHCSLI